MSQPTENLLSRNDKHFLGGGKRVIWAPEFPQFLNKPGFWDHACFLDYKIEPLFTITFLDEDLNELDITAESKQWVPSHLTQHYKSIDSLQITEQKFLLPTDVLTSNLKIKNNSHKQQKIHVIAWTCQSLQQNINQQTSVVMKEVHALRSRISWEKEIYQKSSDKPLLKYGMTIGSQKYAQSISVNASNSTWNYPLWKLTPFYEKFSDPRQVGRISSKLYPNFHAPILILKSITTIAGMAFD